MGVQVVEDESSDNFNEYSDNYHKRCCCLRMHVKKATILFGVAGTLTCSIGILFSAIRSIATPSIQEYTGFPAPYFVGGVITLYSMGMVSVICLFIGIYREDHRLLVPVMIMQLLGIVLFVIGICLFGVALAMFGRPYSVGLVSAWSGRGADSQKQLMDDMGTGFFGRAVAIATIVGFCFGIGLVARVVFVIKCCYGLFKIKRQNAEEASYTNPVFTVLPMP